MPTNNTDDAAADALEAVAEARQRLAEVPASVVVTNHAMGLFELAAIHLSAEPARLAVLDSAFAFTRSGNSEILCAWLQLAIRNGYAAADRRLELFLMTVGRRKFLKPLYEAMLQQPGGKARAQAIYQKARPRYHAVSQRTLDELVGIAGR